MTTKITTDNILDGTIDAVDMKDLAITNAKLAGSIDVTSKLTGSVPTTNLPTIPVSKGGTGLTSLGSAGQAVKVNSGASALEFGSASKVLQVVKSLVTTKASTTSAIPQDNTIPQNTEGTEFTTLAITPQASDSTLYIDFLVHGSMTNNNTNLTVCLFKDSDANALQVVNNTCNTNTELYPLMLKFAETSGTTSSVTYKIRFGLNGGGTVYLNSDQSSDVYSTSQSAIFTITEVSA
jgi:hypothetical protein